MFGTPCYHYEYHSCVTHNRESYCMHIVILLILRRPWNAHTYTFSSRLIAKSFYERSKGKKTQMSEGWRGGGGDATKEKNRITHLVKSLNKS